MLKIMEVNNIVLVILVIFLGAISGKYIKMVKTGVKNNNLNYKKGNLYKLISSISLIIGVILSATIYF